MWKTYLETEFEGSIDRVWSALITPSLWVEIDPEHYTEVNYPKETLEVGIKGKMKTEKSPGAFGFDVVSIDASKHEIVTVSQIPAGKLTITKRVLGSGSKIVLKETVTASGPFSKLMAKIFFKQQIEATLPDQHARIKEYAQSE